MSELIKEITTESMIAMTRLRSLSLLGIALMFVLLLSTGQHVEAVGPDIWEWGVEGEPLLGEGFDVWANVTDEDLDLKNVTVEVVGPNMSVNNLMTFNGTFYTGSVPAFPNDGEFSVRILAYDLANNSRNSARIFIEFEADPEPLIDPTATMPVVVLSSLGLAVVVIGLAMFYDKRNSVGDLIAQPESNTLD